MASLINFSCSISQSVVCGLTACCSFIYTGLQNTNIFILPCLEKLPLYK